MKHRQQVSACRLRPPSSVVVQIDRTEKTRLR